MLPWISTNRTYLRRTGAFEPLTPSMGAQLQVADQCSTLVGKTAEKRNVLSISVRRRIAWHCPELA